jgi:hypothetical protein
MRMEETLLNEHVEEETNLPVFILSREHNSSTTVLLPIR